MIEALKFLLEWKRMCKSFGERCGDCPLWINHADFWCNHILDAMPEEDAEKIVSIVSEWSKEHPIVTNEMKVREVFGDNAANSILALHPSDIKRWLAKPYKERES